jgi:hypothetical protein
LRNIDVRGLSRIEEAYIAPQMSTLIREVPEEVRLKLELTISVLMDYYGIQNDRMIDAIVETILEDWKLLTVSDIILAIKWGRQGRWGKNYGNFSGKLVSEWILEYDKEKSMYAHEKNHAPNSIRQRINGVNYLEGKAIRVNEFTDEEKKRIELIDQQK